jgi:hypothetical protein
MFFIYLMVMLDSISKFFLAFAIISGISALTFTIVHFVNKYDPPPNLAVAKTMGKYASFFWIIFTSSLFTTCILPSTKEAAFIYIGGKLATNQKVEQIGNKTLDLSAKLIEYANQYVDDKIMPKGKEIKK